MNRDFSQLVTSKEVEISELKNEIEKVIILAKNSPAAQTTKYRNGTEKSYYTKW